MLFRSQDGQIAGALHAFPFDDYANDPPPDPRVPEERYAILKPFEDLPAPGTYFVNAISVYPEFCRRGIASSLLSLAFEHGKEAAFTEISLLVYGGNTGAVALYEKRGFKVVGREPVVERTNFTLDVQTGGQGLPVAEQQRIAGWFDAMGLGYGDRISLDDPTANPAVSEDLAALAERHGLLVSDGSPVTAGYVAPGQARIVITRPNSSGRVPSIAVEAPNWFRRWPKPSTSARRGRLRRVSGSSVSSAQGRRVSAAFLAPEIGRRPASRCPPRMRMRSIPRP